MARDNYSRVKKWRKENPDKARAIQKRSYERKAAIVRAAKAVPCCDCDIQYPYWVMQFDHLDGKEFQISGSLMSTSIDVIIREISKCEVVCANCHADRSYRRMFNGRPS